MKKLLNENQKFKNWYSFELILYQNIRKPLVAVWRPKDNTPTNCHMQEKKNPQLIKFLGDGFQFLFVRCI